MARKTKTLNDFTTIRTEGAMLPADVLRRVAAQSVDGMKSTDYDLPTSVRLNEAISQAWTRALAHWQDFQAARADILDEDETGTVTTRKLWLMPLLEILGFGRLEQQKSPIIEEKSYPIQFGWQQVPIHLLGCKLPIDRRTRNVAGAATASPHSTVQEFLNRSDEHLWAILTNGLQLRLLRDNHSLSRQAYVEFDLESMMDGEVYSDFAMLWLVCHVTRFAGEKPESCWLECWSQLAAEEGTRVLGSLRDGVEKAIEAIGKGAVSHPANDELRDLLRSGALDKQELYREILRTVYRLLFLFVAEDRDLLLLPRTDDDSREAARGYYRRHYSTHRLRELADRIRGSGHGDLWHGLTLVFAWLDDPEGCSELALPGLGSFLWSPESTPHLLGPHQDLPELDESAAAPCRVELDNEHLLGAIRALAFTEIDGLRRPVDYRNLGAEELGSIYESLLELVPEVVATQTADSSRFDLRTAAGNDRKTSGSYYTPDSLVQLLLDSALEPVVADRVAGCRTSEEKAEAILSITTCDPSVGSGHFIIAAAHRLAHHLARYRTGDAEPAPEDYQAALRDVIRRCVYGVDMNPMAAELCKVSLWIESMEPGKPLSFLDQHIQVGNSLIGCTPSLLAGGLPDSAFKAIEGDESKAVSALKSRNKNEHKDREKGQGLIAFGTEETSELADQAAALDAVDDDDVSSVRAKADRYAELRQDPLWRRRKLASDAWCAAFVWMKDGGELSDQCPTDADIQSMLAEDDYAARNPDQVAEIDRLTRRYQFFHWHLAFPHVLGWHDTPPVPQEVSA